jgi:hypothetical protein
MLDATVANSERKALVQSDKAPNYRDFTTEIDLLAVGTRCYIKVLSR